eukprot:TRINITY_DN20023_c0_g1_i1.p1 TRINITY_DN20023_c0_g1~~TRINITY_DN20023_c0_g1_i1.p1  ORF type:complete len:257 (+),score=81.00 TRINITY_DN20023_c0_g1_i1:89-859(+)
MIGKRFSNIRGFSSLYRLSEVRCFSSSGRMAFYHPKDGIRLEGIIFDMDGTLTKPCIDFKLMRHLLGIEAPRDVLSVIRDYPDAARRAEAYRIIDQVEEEARGRLELQPGIEALMNYLDAHGLRRAIVTRNSAHAIEHLCERMAAHGVADRFTHKISRDFFPFKPDPASAVHICRDWSVSPGRVMFVGDFRDDLVCGRAAGNVTCLLRNSANEQFVPMAHVTVGRLDELVALLEQGFAAEMDPAEPESTLSGSAPS